MSWVSRGGLIASGVALLVGAASGWLAAKRDAAQDWPRSWRHEMRGHLARVDGNAPAGAVAFLGASTVQGLAVAAVHPCGVNFGIGGETARELAARVEGMRSLDRSRAIVVMTGLNDVLRGRDADLAASYARLLTAIPPRLPVAMIALQEAPAHAAGVRRANALARDACARREGCRFVDFAGALRGRAGIWEEDGVHLTPAGYNVLQSRLAAALEDMNVGPAGGATAAAWCRGGISG